MNPMQMETQTPVSLDEMVVHEAALEAYPWLSAQILNRWKRQNAIRCFRGKDGKVVYPKSDLTRALNKEIGCESPETPQEASLNTEVSGSLQRPVVRATTASGTMTEADVLREKRSLRLISSRRKKN